MRNVGYKDVIRDFLGQAFGGGQEAKVSCIQEMIPIKEIVYGMIVTNDERYLKIVEVEPTNFPLKESKEQERIISTFANWLKVAPTRCQLKITTEIRTDNPYVTHLKERKQNVKDKMIQAIYESNINYITEISSRTALMRKHYIIFEYDSPKRNDNKSYEYIAQQLENTVIQAKEYFANMGNIFVSHEDENIFLGELLYNHLNKHTSKKVDFLEHAERIISDIERISKQSETSIDIEYVNLIAPMGMSTKTSADCVITDQTYHAYYYIPNDGYPMEVYSGWISSIFANMAGVDIDIYYRKTDKLTFQKMLGQQMKFTQYKAKRRTELHSDFGAIVNAYQSQQYLNDALANDNNHQDPYYAVTILSVHAESYEQLQDLCEKLENKAKTNRLKIVSMNYFQNLGFQATLPFNDIPAKIYYKARRNVLTDDLSGFYPFTEYELNDSNGIFLGINLANKSVCTLDVYNRDKYSNANMIILGGSGAGKTYSLSVIADRQVLLGKQIYVITSEKGHEFRRLCKALNGTYIKFASEKRPNVNIFEIRPESEIKDILYGETGSVSWLIKKTASISGWFQLLFKNLTEEESTLLDRATKEMYARKGITTDNNSIYIDNDPLKGIKEMPIIEDIIDVLRDIDKDPMTPVPQRILSILSNFVAGSNAGFNGQTNVDLSDDRRIIVFDLEDIATNIEAATIHLALDFIWGRVKEDPTKQKTIIIEEGWKFLSQGASESSAKLIQEIYKIIRGYGGNAILATQEIGDLIASPYGRSLIECSSLKLLMGVEEGNTAKLLQQHFGLFDNEAKNLESYRKGACLLLAGKDHIPLQIKASPLEHELITTDSKDLALTYQRILSNKN